MINLGAGLAKIAGILKMGAGLPAIAGVVLAAVVGTYIAAPQLFKAGEESGSQSAPASPAVDSSASAPPSAPAEAPATEIASVEPVEPEGADSWVVPSFDVLRVERDGSTVIAGRAEPGTTLTIMNGDTAIASTEVGPNGDFAAVLDEPLAPGDYQLTLQILGKDGQTRRSEEVATVSIPKEPGGDLLAMVSKPGKASRIIVQPEAPAADTPVEVASAGSGETGSEPAATPVAPAAPETATGTEAAPQAEAADVAVATDPGQVETPALPEASALLTTTAPEIAAPEAGTEGATGTEAATAGEPATEVTLATPEAAAEPAAIALPAGATVRVDAVEIEGDRIFVAGSATPGYPVRVSADGVVIGTEKADETGRFIIEATTELVVGEHIINADLMDSTGQEIVLRATVPFNRPAGDSLAAVAPSSPPTAQAAAPEALILPDIASLSQMREDSFEALSNLEKLVSAPQAPDAGAVSAAYEDTIARLRAAARADLPAGSSAEAMAMAQSMRAQAEAALAVIAPPASDGADQADSASGAGVTTDLGKLRETVRQAESALTEPGPSAVAAADASDAAGAAGGQAAEPRTIVQAPLASTPGAVIIRRGDTLWQISRRTYGQGVRYTTIYVANRSQIQNPDRIKPGQVFSVPESPLENAEELHKQLLDPVRNP